MHVCELFTQTFSFRGVGTWEQMAEQRWSTVCIHSDSR